MVLPDGGHDFAQAIMTTDTRRKEAAVTVKDSLGGSYTIAGCAKGAGMIHPNMATMLAFITTDAEVEPAYLQAALRRAADLSFNMVSIDGDTSTNDTLILLANGQSRVPPIGSRAARPARSGPTSSRPPWTLCAWSWPGPSPPTARRPPG